MATIVQSRFAGLKIEDDDFTPAAERPKKAKNPPPKKPEPPKKLKSKPASQQNGNAGKKKNKKVVPTEEQWEQWKQKDEEMVDGAYEAELTQAILLSKLDYEEKKDVYKQIRKQAETDKKLADQAAKEQSKSGQKKQKKKNVMSLEQFNDMVSGDDQKRGVEEQPEIIEHTESDREYFDRAEQEAQVELRKDKHKAQVLQRQPPSDQIINRVQFAEALERKDKEIAVLQEERSRLKEELLLVKSRNKKLCNILGQGEMRDKAEALVEVEKLRQVQAELTAEVASLHAQLEQERSRHPDPRAKDKRKKSTTDKDK